MDGLRAFGLLALLVAQVAGSMTAWAQVRSLVVDVGVMQTTGEGSLYIAMEKGYLKELGVEAKLRIFGSTSVAMAPLASKELQAIVSVGINPAMFNAFVRGLPLIIPAGSGQVRPGNEADRFLVRADLKDQIKEIKDLKGRRVGINAPVSPMLYVLAKSLATVGMSLKDVQAVFVQFPEMGAAFKGKAIDAAILVEPGATLEDARGIALKWKGTAEVMGNFQVSVILYNSDWARAQPEAADRFMLALVKGAREYYQADRKGPNRDEVINVLTKYTRLKDPKLFQRVEWTYWDPNLRLDMESLKDQQDWWHEQGKVPTKANLDKVIVPEHLEAAIKKLGEWKEGR